MNVFDKLLDFEYKKDTGLVNMTGGFFALFLRKLFLEENRALLVVTPNIYEARKLYNKFDNDVILFEDDELNLGDGTSISPEIRIDRINILNDLIKDGKRIVLTDARGYLRRLPKPSLFSKLNLKFKVGDSFSVNEIIDKLSSFGYNRTSVVDKTGDFSVRGFVLDIFPVNEDSPVRIEFFGDDIESIRFFDVDSQRSFGQKDEVEVLPFTETACNNDASIFDYLDNPIVIYKDYEQVKFMYDKMVADDFKFGYDTESNFFDIRDINISDKLFYFDFDSPVNCNYLSDIVSFGASQVPMFNEDFSFINKYVSDAVKDLKTVVLCVTIANFNGFLDRISEPFVITDFDNIYEGKVNVINKKLAEGFEFKNYVFLTDYELFGKKSVVYKKSRFKNSSKIRDLSKIDIGDYVVHDAHGIGVYNGIRVLTKGGVKADYLEILYDKGDKLYIPVSKLSLISKYNGKDGYVPRINALNSVAWVKAKKRIKEKIRYEAEKLIKIQAEREVKKGFAFSPDQPLQKVFEAEFAYEPTTDQLRALSEIKADMESSTPMDRILCGDVGYGKTEVAFRAMFKAVLDGKQVLYLCPTTLLCRQQYEVAVDRFKNYPVNIGVLNRFVSSSQVKKTMDGLSSGKIDIVFGTHRALSNDVIFKDLGLLVVDEEQRFGVAHKEKIKEIKASVDVLTLTATPIPRTLQMAVLGIKNMSLIETPPKNRKSVVTYVTPYDKKLIREVIYKELARDGQVFILYNRVEDIERKVYMFKELVPDASFGFAHGKMDKNSFEQVMDDFVNKKFDVLVCTTIIETGVDIPNVNSLIVIDADRFGLSQLYQIRGRVGRSDNVAYAYLMYEKGKVLTEKAVKRLKVIKDFTELGSGFSIATRDLSIRGAGDILGSEQAGFIDTVGMDMYLKMLNEEVAKLKGVYQDSLDDEDNYNLVIPSHVDDSYVMDEDVKIEIHKMVNGIDSFDSLQKIKVSIEDRFGPVPEKLFIYMNEKLFENLAKRVGIVKIFDNNKYREVFFSRDASLNIDYEEFFVRAINVNRNFNFSYKNDVLRVRLFYKDSKSNLVFDFNELFKGLL